MDESAGQGPSWRVRAVGRTCYVPQPSYQDCSLVCNFVLDALVFAGGIGENSAEVRAAVAESFAFLGLAIEVPRWVEDGVCG
jgi:hypothetical protein